MRSCLDAPPLLELLAGKDEALLVRGEHMALLSSGVLASKDEALLVRGGHAGHSPPSP